MLKTITTIAAAAILGCAAVPAGATVFTLDFTGVASGAVASTIGDFYNGGTSGAGLSGTNYGVTFIGTAIAANSYTGANEPDPGVLIFGGGEPIGVNVASGFTNSFGFSYSSATSTTITLYDGLSGTGAVLATLALPYNYNSTCGYCRWDSATVSFAGIARSIDFGGSGEFAGFDRLSFGSADAVAVPEPASWAMLLAGFATIGVGLLGRRAFADGVRVARV